MGIPRSSFRVPHLDVARATIRETRDKRELIAELARGFGSQPHRKEHFETRFDPSSRAPGGLKTRIRDSRIRKTPTPTTPTYDSSTTDEKLRVRYLPPTGSKQISRSESPTATNL